MDHSLRGFGMREGTQKAQWGGAGKSQSLADSASIAIRRVNPRIDHPHNRVFWRRWLWITLSATVKTPPISRRKKSRIEAAPTHAA